MRVLELPLLARAKLLPGLSQARYTLPSAAVRPAPGVAPSLATSQGPHVRSMSVRSAGWISGRGVAALGTCLYESVGVELRGACERIDEREKGAFITTILPQQCVAKPRLEMFHTSMVPRRSSSRMEVLGIPGRLQVLIGEDVAPRVQRVAGKGRWSPQGNLAIADGGCSSGRVRIPSSEDLGAIGEHIFRKAPG